MSRQRDRSGSVGHRPVTSMSDDNCRPVYRLKAHQVQMKQANNLIQTWLGDQRDQATTGRHVDFRATPCFMETHAGEVHLGRAEAVP